VERRPSLWAVSELPLAGNPPPAELIGQITAHRALCLAEEHVAQGGVASDLAIYLMERGIAATLTHLCARAHHYPRYGSQTYLRAQSGLDPLSLLAAIGAC